jgi:hypothetical protein
MGMRPTCRRVLSSAPLYLIGTGPVVACGNEAYKLNLRSLADPCYSPFIALQPGNFSALQAVRDAFIAGSV